MAVSSRPAQKVSKEPSAAKLLGFLWSEPVREMTLVAQQPNNKLNYNKGTFLGG